MHHLQNTFINIYNHFETEKSEKHYEIRFFLILLLEIISLAVQWVVCLF